MIFIIDINTDSFYFASLQNTRSILLFLFLLLNFFQDTFLIESIQIRGNEATVDYVIRREILFNEGEFVSTADIEKSQKRIESLFIFNSVSYELKNDSVGYILTYIVSEKLNLFIVPIIKLTDDKLDRLTYGIAVNHSNFLGRKYFLSFQTLFGDRSGFRLRFSDPWFAGNLRLFYAVTLENIKNSNVLNIDILNQTHLADVTIGKGFGPYFRVGLNSRYQKTFFNFEDRSYSLSNSTSDKQITYGINLNFDNRDFFLYPQKGFSARLYYDEGSYIESDEDGFDRWGLDFSIYHSYGNFTIGHYLTNGSVSGNVTYYNQFAFGDSRVIRGHSFPRKFGNHLFISRNEIRYRFMDDQLISINPPYFSKYTQNMRISCFAYTFLDSGVLYDQFSKIQYNDFKTGFGAGVGIYTPYLPYFAIEYGRNVLGYSELALALRSSL